MSKRVDGARLAGAITSLRNITLIDSSTTLNSSFLDLVFAATSAVAVVLNVTLSIDFSTRSSRILKHVGRTSFARSVTSLGNITLTDSSTTLESGFLDLVFAATSAVAVVLNVTLSIDFSTRSSLRLGKSFLTNAKTARVTKCT